MDNKEQDKPEERNLVQSEQTEVTIKKFDDSGAVISKVVTVTTQYTHKIDSENTGLYL